MNHSIKWDEQTALITGHTGFKGGWLALWLNQLGTKIHGYALMPPTQPNLFNAARIHTILASDTRADLADLYQLKSALKKSRPTVIFHLAAQSLVRESYRDPLNTLTSNVMGTAHLLEAAREIDSVRAVIIVTTDKVYENEESTHAYTENDALGGYDIYSASKAAVEIITSSYRRSFFNNSSERSVKIATVRAGNVFGGGDWATDRLIPDCIRSFEAGKPVSLRFPHAIRPWQHVLEPLAGYLKLAEKLLSAEGSRFSRAWNFGPDIYNDITVGNIAKMIAKLWSPDSKVIFDESAFHPHEANCLKLNSQNSENQLNWKPRWNLEQAMQKTVNWYKASKQGADMHRISVEQIHSYLAEKEYV